MARNVLLALDKFKGSLTSAEAAASIARGLAEAAICKLCPMADGGEGSMNVLRDLVGGEVVGVDAHDALMRPLVASYLLTTVGGRRTAFIESASVCGLQQLGADERNPLFTSSFALGEMVRHAVCNGASEVMITLGGSATNDCGTGMLSALGYRFTDSCGKTLAMCGQALSRVAAVDDSGFDRTRYGNVHFSAACDVTNPLLGLHGASRVFAPQKGADCKEVEMLESGMSNFCRVVADSSFGMSQGDGAAGGLGAAMRYFIGAEMVSGWRMIADYVLLDDLARDAELIITGEGKIDSQSLDGKLVGGIASLAREMGKPCWAFCGRCELSAAQLRAAGIERVFALSDLAPDLETSVRQAGRLLSVAAADAAKYM